MMPPKKIRRLSFHCICLLSLVNIYFIVETVMLHLLSAYRGEQRLILVLCRYILYQQWLHRYCAGVSAKCYKDIKGKKTSFSCFACSQVSHECEVSALKDTIELLNREITDLKSSMGSSVHLVYSSSRQGFCFLGSICPSQFYPTLRPCKE